jgi:hypothetical protein
MEPIAAVGLAFNIFQFVDCTSKLIKTAKELRDNASSAENSDHLATVTHLRTIAQSLRATTCAVEHAAQAESPEDQVSAAYNVVSKETLLETDVFLENRHFKPSLKAVVSSLSNSSSVSRLAA